MNAAYLFKSHCKLLKVASSLKSLSNSDFTNLDKFSSNGLTYNEEWYLPSKVTVNLHDIKTDNINLTRHEKLPEKIVVFKGLDEFKHRFLEPTVFA